MKQALFWMAGYDGCGYYRMLLPATNLPDDRWKCHASVLSGNDWPRYDVIIGQRIYMNEEGMAPVENWVQMCNDPGMMTVYEVDDDLFNVPEGNPAFDVFADEGVQNNIAYCAARADLVTVSTEPLRDVMLKYNPNVDVIPNFIDESMLKVERIRNKWPIIGWGGSATHGLDFDVLGDAIGEAMLLQPQSLAFIMGGERSYSAGVPSGRLKRIPWVRDPAKVWKWTREFDIGLAPLANNAFNESKSRVKVLEYAALGIPVIASDVPAYREFVDHGVTGFLARSQREWREYIRELLNDEPLREKMGAAARAKATQFTIQGNIHLWEEALNF